MYSTYFYRIFKSEKNKERQATLSRKVATYINYMLQQQIQLI